MNERRQLQLAGAGICAFAAWNARDLLNAWLHSPFDRAGGIAFLIWLAPVVVAVWRGEKPRPVWFGVALACSVIGSVVDLNVLKHLGLAFACFGFVAPGGASWLWLACALSWMPVAGWSLKAAGVLAVGAIRVLAAIAGAGAALMTSPKTASTPESVSS